VPNTRQGNTHAPWSAPSYRKGRIFTQPGVDRPPQPLGGVTGTWNCCDVWLEVPDGWLPSEVWLYQEIDGVAVQVGHTVLSDCHYVTDGTTAQVLAFSVRGHPGTGWTMRIQGATTATGQGEIRWMCWGQDGAAENPRITPRRYDSGELLETDTIIEAPCKLIQLFGVNDSAALVYVQLHDLIGAIPALAAPALAALPVAAGQAFSYSFAEGGWRFETGLVWAASSTIDTYTATGTDDLTVSALYWSP